MKLFKCTNCAQLVYFENNQCENCKSSLGFLATDRELYALKNVDGEYFKCNDDQTAYKFCNNSAYNVCNWLIPADSNSSYCAACELNHTIPDVGQPKYANLWWAIEAAKHRLIYSLLELKLPLISKRQDAAKGLSFDFLADGEEGKKVITGHDNGLITLNVAEADDISREMARKQMDEPYRTLLGHFRHEVGHYYWDRLLDNSQFIEEYRKIFGDERADYSTALKNHYEHGPVKNWCDRFISAYASSHPWEDWAETWAHYLHIMDTLQTAYAFGLNVAPKVDSRNDTVKAAIEIDPYNETDFCAIINRWHPLTLAMNSLNRSMGHHDLYPFIIPQAVIEKLTFIHKICSHGRNV
jgi:hypothetical protein